MALKEVPEGIQDPPETDNQVLNDWMRNVTDTLNRITNANRKSVNRSRPTVRQLIDAGIANADKIK